MKFGARSLVRSLGREVWCAKFGARSVLREVWRAKFSARSFASEVLRAKFCAQNVGARSFAPSFVRGKCFYKIPPKLQRKLPGLLLRLVGKISLEISRSCASEFSRIRRSFADFRRPGTFAVLLSSVSS